MSIERDVKRGVKQVGRDIKHAERDVKRDVKKIARDVKHTVKPPWYRRAWNRVRNVFRR